MKSYLWAWGFFALCFLGCIGFALSGYQWQGWSLASCMPSKCFCEHLRHGSTVLQPMNAWSNMGFVLVGVWVAWRSNPIIQSQRAQDNPMTRTEVMPLTYAVIIALVGFTSLFYHASMTFIGQWFDVMGMYLIVSFMILYNLSRIFRLNRTQFLGWYLAANLVFGWFQYAFPVGRRFLFLSLMLTSFFLEIQANKGELQRKRKYLHWAIVFILAAGTFWLLDSFRVSWFCFPKSFFQGHALWHLCGAISSFFIFRYYESEERHPLPQKT